MKLSRTFFFYKINTPKKWVKYWPQFPFNPANWLSGLRDFIRYFKTSSRSAGNVFLATFTFYGITSGKCVKVDLY